MISRTAQQIDQTDLSSEETTALFYSASDKMLDIIRDLPTEGHWIVQFMSQADFDEWYRILGGDKVESGFTQTLQFLMSFHSYDRYSQKSVMARLHFPLPFPKEVIPIDHFVVTSISRA